MIIGKISRGEKRVKFNITVKCTNCKTSVPGGMQASEKYYGTDSFIRELDDFMKNYFCGRCRDKKRVNKKLVHKD